MWSLGVSLLICRVTTNFPFLAIKAGRFTSHCGETGVLHALFFYFIFYFTLPATQTAAYRLRARGSHVGLG